ncbi:MAG TPA: hypothetical protein PKA19_07295 [Bacillota bacterium]|nr:hypothetical protein [Bacillota bacterium]
MNEITKSSNRFVGYEYKDVTVKQEIEAIYSDCYPNFGWELENTSVPLAGIGTITMKFKRDRKIRNKAELTRLQRQFDSLAGEIVTLEHSKVIGAATAAYVIGVTGTAFMAGSVFAFLADMLPLSIVLAIPAFIGWVMPYFCFTKIRRNKTAKVEPLIDQKYDEIYEVCEKANSLLSK